MAQPARHSQKCSSRAALWLSESQPNCKLHRARPADLVQRAESRKLTLKRRAQGSSRLAEQCAGKRSGGLAEIRVVQDVEEFRDEKDLCLLPDRELTADGKIVVPCSIAANRVTRHIALHSCRRTAERALGNGPYAPGRSKLRSCQRRVIQNLARLDSEIRTGRLGLLAQCRAGACNSSLRQTRSQQLESLEVRYARLKVV